MITSGTEQGGNLSLSYTELIHYAPVLEALRNTLHIITYQVSSLLL